MRDDIHVFCDFDGTIADRDVTDALLEAFALPQWREAEALWKDAVIGSGECMRLQVDLLRCTRREMDLLLDTVSIDPAFPDFVAACRGEGIPVTVVSDGIDYAIHRILGNYGLEDLPVYANRLGFRSNGLFRLDSPHASRACPWRSGTCKCALMRRLTGAGTKTVLVGDGTSDVCAATQAARFVFAKDSLLRHCRAHNLPHAPYASFLDIRRQLMGLEQDGGRLGEIPPVTNDTGHPHNG